MARAIVLILDSLGIGAAEDAVDFGDAGSNTLGHIASEAAQGRLDHRGRRGALLIPNLVRMGLAHACELSCGAFPAGVAREEPVAAYGYARELSWGKDTPSGHWEIAGVPVMSEWGLFPSPENCFPADLLEQIIQRAGLPGILGNCHASGTEILDRLGEEHIRSGKPIFYTSADSVFQIACSEESFGLERLYQLCDIVRDALEPYNVGRVIARPFVGSRAGGFSRTGNRRDLALEPPAPTVLKKLADAGGEVISVGKIADIYAHVGITRSVKASGFDALWAATMEQVRDASERSLVMTNFVDFDSSYGHRRDVAGYAAALEAFDPHIPGLLELLRPDDILIFSADHGCDPTWPGSDHTREHIPVLCFGARVAPGSLGCRNTFADIGQSLASHLGLPPMDYGTSFIV
jgi:phosphopentomutase